MAAFVSFALLFPLRGRWLASAVVLGAALFGAAFILRLPTRPRAEPAHSQRGSTPMRWRTRKSLRRRRP